MQKKNHVENHITKDFRIPGYTQEKDESHKETTSHNIEYLNNVHQNGHHI